RLRIQRHLFGRLYVEQAGDFSRWDRDLDLSLIALSDLPTIGRWVPRVNNSLLRSDSAGTWMVRRLRAAPGHEAARGGFLQSAAAIAEISGRMKKASSAG